MKMSIKLVPLGPEFWLCHYQYLIPNTFLSGSILMMCLEHEENGRKENERETVLYKNLDFLFIFSFFSNQTMGEFF